MGDLTSILKVDQRRRDAARELYEDKQALFLIDRYKFLNLAPCTPEQLKFMGYNVGAVSPLWVEKLPFRSKCGTSPHSLCLRRRQRRTDAQQPHLQQPLVRRRASWDWRLAVSRDPTPTRCFRLSRSCRPVPATIPCLEVCTSPDSETFGFAEFRHLSTSFFRRTVDAAAASAMELPGTVRRRGQSYGQSCKLQP